MKTILNYKNVSISLECATMYKSRFYISPGSLLHFFFVRSRLCPNRARRAEATHGSASGAINHPSPFFFVILSFLGDSKKERYLRLFYSYIYSLIYFIYSSFIIFLSCLCGPVSKGNNFSLRGSRLPAYFQAAFVAYLRPFFARNPPACIFAGGFRSAQGIGARRSVVQRRTFAMNA